MNASSTTSHDVEASNRRASSSQSNQQSNWIPDETYNHIPASWDIVSQHPYVVPACQPSSSTHASSSSLAMPSRMACNAQPPWLTTETTLNYRPLQADTSTSDHTTADTAEPEFQPEFLDWFSLIQMPEGQTGSDVEASQEATAPGLIDPLLNLQIVMQPDLTHSSASSISTSSSSHSVDPADSYITFPQPEPRLHLAAGSHSEDVGAYFSLPFDCQTGQSGLTQQTQAVPWPTQEQSSDSILCVRDGGWLTYTADVSSSQGINTANTQARVNNTHRISKTDPLARPATNPPPLYINRPSRQQVIESPLISPLTIPAGGSFQASQTEAISRLNIGTQARPTLAPSRRRSAVYYRHGRKVADATIDVYEDTIESPLPDLGSRNRTTSCDSTMQPRKRLGDITNRSHTVSGPTSRTQLRKQSAPVSVASNDLKTQAVPVGLSNLAWVNNGFGNFGADGTGQQRDPMVLLDRFRDSLLTQEASSSSHALPRQADPRSS